MTDPTHTLGGRAVDLRVVSYGTLMQARRIIAKDENMVEEASTLILVQSAHWADSGERIFKSVDDLNNNWPATSAVEIMNLITEAAALNRPRTTPTADQDGAPPLTTNGAAPADVPLA